MRIDWKSPETLEANKNAADGVMEVLFGVYLWEWANSLNFDWAFISGRKRFHWPMVGSVYQEVYRTEGQFGVIIRSIPTRIRGSYVEECGCVMVSTETKPAAVLYIVTMVVDFVILLLTVYKTYVEYRDMYHSGLIRLIFRDGLAYFAVV
ncbi:hypothetical protein PQX77_010688 [Marasmius sp. AFHP31]|nr:hypothetical protein PQX77_010688 [Marasmius sp. AFHP31]